MRSLQIGDLSNGGAGLLASYLPAPRPRLHPHHSRWDPIPYFTRQKLQLTIVSHAGAGKPLYNVVPIGIHSHSMLTGAVTLVYEKFSAQH